MIEARYGTQAAFVERGRCLPLRDGVEVTVVDRVGAGAVAFVVRGEPGVRFYTITEAVS